MFKLNHLIFLVAVSMAGNFAYAQNPSAENSDMKSSENPIKQRFIEWTLTDQKFVDKALEAGRAEVELSQLALQKSTSEKIKSFAQKMVDDHSKASLDLKTIAQGKNLDIPLEMDAAHTKALKKLQTLEGASFDANYIDLMVEDHDKSVSLFVAASADKKLDTQLQAFAQKILPVLREHLAHVKALEKVEISSPK